MTDPRNDDDNGEEKEECFAALLDTYSPGTGTEISIGDKIRGRSKHRNQPAGQVAHTSPFKVVLLLFSTRN